MALRASHWKGALVPVFLVALVLGARAFLPYEDWLEDTLSRFRGLGWRGGVGLFGVVVLGMMICAPGSVMAVATGFMLGVGWGLPVMWGGALLGSGGAFLLSRFFLRDRIRGWIARWARVARLEAALSEGNWKLVALLRLTPLVPFFVLNYLSGATRMRGGAFLVGTGIAMLPGTAVYVSLGAGARSIAGNWGAWGWEKWTLVGIGMVATLGTGVWARGLACEKLPGVADP